MHNQFITVFTCVGHLLPGLVRCLLHHKDAVYVLTEKFNLNSLEGREDTTMTIHQSPNSQALIVQSLPYGALAGKEEHLTFPCQ